MMEHVPVLQNGGRMEGNPCLILEQNRLGQQDYYLGQKTRASQIFGVGEP